MSETLCLPGIPRHSPLIFIKPYMCCLQLLGSRVQPASSRLAMESSAWDLTGPREESVSPGTSATPRAGRPSASVESSRLAAHVSWLSPTFCDSLIDVYIIGAGLLVSKMFVFTTTDSVVRRPVSRVQWFISTSKMPNALVSVTVTMWSVACRQRYREFNGRWIQW